MHNHPMPGWQSSPHTSHSNEVENRLTRSEIKLEAHGERISNMERLLLVILYALGLVSAKLSGEMADILLKVIRP